MNIAMKGSEFNFANKYASTLAIIFCCILYFGPVPILLPIASLYMLIQWWMDKSFFLTYCKNPPYTGASMHMVAMKILPWSLIGHCIFSMWAYGSPTIWPEGFHASGTNSSGNTTYSPDGATFAERLFNSNSIIFFLLFIVFVFGYFFENIVLGIVDRVIHKNNAAVDATQPSYNEAKKDMSEWTVVSYNPSCALRYNKVLKAMLDVAEVNDEPDNSNGSPKKKNENINSNGRLLDHQESNQEESEEHKSGGQETLNEESENFNPFTQTPRELCKESGLSTRNNHLDESNKTTDNIHSQEVLPSKDQTKRQESAYTPNDENLKDEEE
jgi:hypothetical protein